MQAQSSSPALYSSHAGENQEVTGAGDAAVHSGGDNDPQLEVSNPSGHENSPSGDENGKMPQFQRDEEFHASLKRAATLRRRLSRQKDSNKLSGRNPEEAVARALDAAAKASASPNPSSQDETFFDTIIERAATTTNESQKEIKAVQNSIMEGSENWSLAEMVDVLVNRSTKAIIRQQKEIHCLRLAIKGLMGEMLQSGGDIESLLRCKGHSVTPTKDQHPGRSPTTGRSFDSTPSTANSTMASSESSTRNTPPSTNTFGPPYSTRAARRHKISREVRISRSSSVDSEDSHGNPKKWQQVPRSLDSQMQEAERQQGVDGLSADSLGGRSSFSEWQQRHKPRHRQSMSREEDTNKVDAVFPSERPQNRNEQTNRATQSEVKPKQELTKFDGGQGHSSEYQDEMRGSQSKATVKTPVGHIVESILDSIIDMSLDVTGEESTVSSLILPGLQPQTNKELDQNSITNSAGTGEERGPRSRPGVQDKEMSLHKQHLNGGYASISPESNLGIAHAGQPARYLRMESRTLDGDGQTQQKISNVVERKNSTRAIVGEQHYEARDATEKRELTGEEGENENDEDGDRRMVVLISGAPVNRSQESDQERSIVILHANNIEAEFLDGADPSRKEIRDSLFGVSGLPGVYPQFFLVEDDGMTEFFGDFQEIEQLNDAGELWSTFLRLSSIHPGENENEGNGSGDQYQEGKKGKPLVPWTSSKESTAISLSQEAMRGDCTSQIKNSPRRSLHTSDDNDDHPDEPSKFLEASTETQAVTDTAVDGDIPDPSTMYIQEGSFSLGNPSNSHDIAASDRRLPVIKEDSSRNIQQESLVSKPYSESDSGSVELYEDDSSSELGWI